MGTYGSWAPRQLSSAHHALRRHLEGMQDKTLHKRFDAFLDEATGLSDTFQKEDHPSIILAIIISLV